MSDLRLGSQPVHPKYPIGFTTQERSPSSWRYCMDLISQICMEIKLKLLLHLKRFLICQGFGHLNGSSTRTIDAPNNSRGGTLQKGGERGIWA